MHYVILGLLLLLLAYAGLRAFLNANPKTMAQTLRKVSGVACILLALFFVATGRFPVAIPIGIFGLGLLARSIPGFPGGFNPFSGSANKSAGQQSRVRTNTIEMELDHDTGDMDGRVLSGAFARRELSSLSQDELLEVWNAARISDPQGSQLLEAYIDRRFPDWREGRSNDSGNGGRSAGAAKEGPMTRDEAYEVLGLKPGASNADIHRAHRNLMKKLHPDHGGSTYLAAKINQAKDLLLG
jgi:DnaJ-domain-containing protein 1